MAARLGRPQSYVSKYELGERRLDVIEFVELIRTLDCDPIPLFRRALGIEGACAESSPRHTAHREASGAKRPVALARRRRRGAPGGSR
ncbi:MAG: helix-turn-helix transcriptional regulator [Acidobacteriota bacterium]